MIILSKRDWIIPLFAWGIDGLQTFRKYWYVCAILIVELLNQAF